MAARRAGWALAVYGVVSLVLLAVAGVLAMDVASRVERLMGGADRTLLAAVRTVDAAADAFRGTDASLAQGQASAERAATLSREAATSMTAIAEAMRVSIFGAQPLLALEDDFTRSAEQAVALSTELDGVAASLGSSRGDLETVADRMSTLATELGSLRGSGGGTADPPPVRPLLLVLLGWLALLPIGALFAAGWLLRSSRPTRAGV
jgi:hypothetical protein